MSTFRTPVGPQPSRVYWRRRLVVLIGALAIILIVVLIVIRPGSGKPDAHKTNPPTSPAAVEPCATSDILVKAKTDANAYAKGVDPMLSLSIQNTGTKACTFATGTTVQKYVITSGSDRIWSSTDCQTGAVALTSTLQPGIPVTSTPFAWNRTRSSPTTCSDKNLPQVRADKSSYHLTVTVNGVTSSTDNSPQFVLK
jgi:hypothetical protein